MLSLSVDHYPRPDGQREPVCKPDPLIPRLPVRRECSHRQQERSDEDRPGVVFRHLLKLMPQLPQRPVPVRGNGEVRGGIRAGQVEEGDGEEGVHEVVVLEGEARDLEAEDLRLEDLELEGVGEGLDCVVVVLVQKAEVQHVFRSVQALTAR